MPVEKTAVNGISAASVSNALNGSSTAVSGTVLNIKDSRWLQLEVCREFQRGQCSRSDLECKFAHPPPHVEVKEGRVTACYDSIKARCTRENPKCKYLHPPQHLKDQLLINGRNNLVIKNLLANQISAQMTTPTMSISPIAAVPGTSALIPNLAAATAASYNPYATYALTNAAAAFYPGLFSAAAASPDPFAMVGGFLPVTAPNSAATLAAMQKMVYNRAERAENAAAAAQAAAAALSVQQQSVNSNPYLAAAVAQLTGKKRHLEPDMVTVPFSAATAASHAETLLLAAAIREWENACCLALNSSPIMNKRAALDKGGGIPVYQPIYQSIPAIPTAAALAGAAAAHSLPYPTAAHFNAATAAIPNFTAAASYMVPAAPLAGNPTSLARF